MFVSASHHIQTFLVLRPKPFEKRNHRAKDVAEYPHPDEQANPLRNGHLPAIQPRPKAITEPAMKSAS